MPVEKNRFFPLRHDILELVGAIVPQERLSPFENEQADPRVVQARQHLFDLREQTSPVSPASRMDTPGSEDCSGRSA